MSILVTGSTGTIGTQVLSYLQGRGVEVRALTRSPEKAKLPSGMAPVRGDLADMDSMRAALDGVSTLFLLVPNVADELTQAMLALTTAREASVKGIVYLSVLKGEAYADVPHFAAKYTVERMIESLDLPVTILRPAYFIQNDIQLKDPLLKLGVYAMPIGARFSRYRRKLGIDERPNGKAKSNVDFHSFRRWFMRKVRDAKQAGAKGFDEWTLVEVVGHTDSDRPKSLDLSQRGYAGRDPEKAKRALVEAVKLPDAHV